MDKRGRVTYLNPSAERTFGYSAGEAIGRELAYVIVPHSYRDAHRRGLNRLLSTGESSILGQRIELTAMRSDGSEFPVELTVTRTDSAGQPGFTGFVRDISERVHTEEELRSARRRVIEASDVARERLTRDIHDGAQQRFVNSLINLQLAERKWSSDPRRAQELLVVAMAESEGGIELLRELAAGIHPAVLSDMGLAVALDELVARLPIPVQLEIGQLELPAPLQASVYFLCSEALTNVVKHAQASSASVHIAARDGELAIEVHDDGIGGAELGAGGSGLIGIADRVAALQGTLELSSPRRRSGTTLRARIPTPQMGAGHA
jgi:PAS domain S-box-containing protein